MRFKMPVAVIAAFLAGHAMYWIGFEVSNRIVSWYQRDSPEARDSVGIAPIYAWLDLVVLPVIAVLLVGVVAARVSMSPSAVFAAIVACSCGFYLFFGPIEGRARPDFIWFCTIAALITYGACRGTQRFMARRGQAVKPDPQ